MKYVYTLLFVFILSGMSSGQNNNLFLKINPLIDNEPLVLNSGKYNAWNSVPFYLTRFQYYLSRILITHDGGQQTAATGVYLLTDPGTLVYSIGNYNIQEVEAIEFYIGIDSKYNHGDPTVYPAGHPLSPQDPSMHWGWAAGYRFTAFEGYSDSGNGLYADKFELHVIGDDLFTKVSLPAYSFKDNTGNLIIKLDADYNKLFTGIDLKGGFIEHGNGTPNDVMMSNFKDVYTASGTTATDIPGENNFRVTYANPNTESVISYDGNDDDIEFKMLNLYGQKVYGSEHLNRSGNISLPYSLKTGFYILSFSRGNELLYINKLIIAD